MNTQRNSWLIAAALWELLRYDIILRFCGFAKLHRGLARRAIKDTGFPECEAAVIEAVAVASCFYPRHVRCLQRSVVSARLLRRRGANADVVIGYRSAPFFSHAWVEVNGKVVGDSPVYQRKMHILDRV